MSNTLQLEQVIIVSQQITLRPVEARDIPELYKLIDQSRPYIAQWLGWLVEGYGIEQQYEYYELSQKWVKQGSGINYVIVWQASPADEPVVCGQISYQLINAANKQLHLGYWLGEGYQGHGIMTTAVRALTEHAFTVLGFNKVSIQAATRNSKSWGIPERLGFKFVGTLRENEWLHDHFVDHRLYEMLKREWQDGANNASGA
jgi:ribosomal-protein-serine acetyltransferase